MTPTNSSAQIAQRVAEAIFVIKPGMSHADCIQRIEDIKNATSLFTAASTSTLGR